MEASPPSPPFLLRHPFSFGRVGGELYGRDNGCHTLGRTRREAGGGRGGKRTFQIADDTFLLFIVLWGGPQREGTPVPILKKPNMAT